MRQPVTADSDDRKGRDYDDDLYFRWYNLLLIVIHAFYKSHHFESWESYR